MQCTAQIWGLTPPADLPILVLLHDGKLRGGPVGRLGHLAHLAQHKGGPLQAEELLVLEAVPAIHVLVPLAYVGMRVSLQSATLHCRQRSMRLPKHFLQLGKLPHIPVSALYPRMVMPVKASLGSQNSLKGVKRSHLQPRGSASQVNRYGPGLQHALLQSLVIGACHRLTGTAVRRVCMLAELTGTPPEVHCPGPLQEERIGAGLANLVHLKDGRQELAQKGHVELVPCISPQACCQHRATPAGAHLGGLMLYVNRWAAFQCCH